MLTLNFKQARLNILKTNQRNLCIMHFLSSGPNAEASRSY